MASVLVVDDDDGTRDSYERFLHLAGYETATAATGRAGVDLALARTFDVHVIDLRLQDMSGVEVVRTLRRRSVAGRIVIVTAFPTIDTSFAAATVGADSYVAGPLYGDDIVELVARTIAGLAPPLAAVHSDLDDGARAENVRALARRLCALARLGTEPVQLMAVALAMRGALADPSALGPQAYPVAVPREVAAIIQCIGAHVAARELPLTTHVAAELGIDSTEIGELLDRHTGAGYREWRRLLRLRGAIQELAETSEQVSQIAFAIGYESLSQFDRDFRAAFGLTPGQFREHVTR